VRNRSTTAMLFLLTMIAACVLAFPRSAFALPCVAEEHWYFGDANCSGLVGYWERQCNGLYYSSGDLTSQYWAYAGECCGNGDDGCHPSCEGAYLGCWYSAQCTNVPQGCSVM